jgi:hypothetical protein
MKTKADQPWTLELAAKPDFDKAMKRVEAWFRHETLDRPPIRFAAHNAFVSDHSLAGRTWPDLKSRWFDAEFQVDFYMESLRAQVFPAETFPVFWPNLGPGVYAAFHGAELEYGEVTSWTQPMVNEWSDVAKIKFDPGNVYFRKIEELTRIALEKCPGKFMVGYTDLHGSLDCAADWRDPQRLCMDIVDEPEQVHKLVRLAVPNFQKVFDHFHDMLRAKKQLSVTWMGIPSFGKMHIPSSDFAALVSADALEEFYIPHLEKEVKKMTHNIYHLDGKGTLRHLDRILQIPEIQAIQWVQGVGDDLPIMQWVPVIKKIQAAGKGVVVDLQPSELDEFMRKVKPDGLYLCISTPPETCDDIIRRVSKWGKK